MKEDFEQIESSQRQHHEVLEHNERMICESLKTDFALFNSLKPTICKEGDDWHVWYGDHYLTSQIIGIGKTIHEAVIDFNGSIYRKID